MLGPVAKLGAYNLRKSLRNHELRYQGAQDMAAKTTYLSGQYMINAAGEAMIEVYFPVLFTEKPLVSFGFEMKDGEVYIEGKMATAEAKVISWITEDKPPFTRYYRGFVIGAVTSGPTFQKMIGIWHATGNALTNPVSPL